MFKPFVRAAGGLPALLLAVAAAGHAVAQSVTAMPQLDLNRFTGTWYEIARLPDKPQQHCVGNAIELYALADKSHRFQFVNSCTMKDGSTDVRNANGKEDKSNDGRLRVNTIWPFTTKRWVLATGPDYEWALVGTPNHKSLWILSRTTSLSPAMLTGIEAKAAAQGFDVSRIVPVNQAQ